MSCISSDARPGTKCLLIIKIVIDNFSAYYGEDSVLHIGSFIHLNNQYSNYYHSHFANEETEAQMK